MQTDHPEAIQNQSASRAEREKVSNTIVGKLLSGPEERDAIHVAVAPVIAACRLSPGQRIDFVSKDDRERVCAALFNPVGIVDPFLNAHVVIGDRFWMFLFPQTITSLKHNWTHPAFDAPTLLSLAHEDWIRNFAASIPLDYDELMQGAREWLRDKEYLCFGGLLEGYSVPDEFWDHYEKVTATVVTPENRGSFFTCSC